MARICIEYECEVKESQRRPANLLDALEQGDHGMGEDDDDDDAVVGEEKVACLLTDTVFCPVCFVEKIWHVYTIANLTVVNVWYSTIIGEIQTVRYSPCLTWASTAITDAIRQQ